MCGVQNVWKTTYSVSGKNITILKKTEYCWYCCLKMQRRRNDFFIGWASRSVDGGTEGSEPSEARGAGAPRGMGSGGYNPQKIFQKSTLKWRIFRHFSKLKWTLLQWCQGRIRQVQNGLLKTSPLYCNNLA